MAKSRKRFEGELVELCADDHDEDLRRSLGEFADRLHDLIVDGIDGRVWSNQQVKEMESVRRRARRQARLFDAAVYVHERGCTATDLRVPSNRNWDLLQNDIDRVFKAVRQSPFVYVAWCAKPKSFHYVGQAGTRKRLNLRKHAVLLQAFTTGATTLSMVLPQRSNANVIDTMEASLILMLDHENDLRRTPRLLNRQRHRERLPRGEGFEKLARVHRELAWYATALSSADVTGEE